MADPDVALEAHDNGDVDRAHHRDLDKGQEPGQDAWVQLQGVEVPQVGEAVQKGTTNHHYSTTTTTTTTTMQKLKDLLYSLIRGERDILFSFSQKIR